MDGLIQSILQQLKTAGVPAVRCFPGGIMPKIVAPVAAVSLERLQALDGGFGRALGDQKGRRVDAVVLVRLFSPDGRGTETACHVLMDSGLVQQVKLAEPVFDDTADCFVTALRAHVTGLLPQADHVPDEGPAFTDFRLEGEMK